MNCGWGVLRHRCPFVPTGGVEADVAGTESTDSVACQRCA